MINQSPTPDQANTPAILHLLGIIDAEPEDEFDNIVRLACLLTAAPAATLTFINQDRNLCKSAAGIDIADLERADQQLKSYSSVYREPIKFNENLLLGHLTVAFTQPTDLTTGQMEGLKLLSKQLGYLLQMRLPVANRSVRDFYESILNNIPTDIVVFDTEHRYLFANPGAIKDEELRKFIIGKDDFEYAVYRKRDPAIAIERRAQFQQVKDTGNTISWEENQKTADGNIVTHLRRMFPVNDDQGKLVMVIGFGIDITERKELENKQRKIMEQLAVQHKQSIDFCNVVSHNLRGPLINLGMLTEFIRESEDPGEQQLLISKMEPVIDNLKSTFNELVESIQVRQETDLKMDELNLNACLSETVRNLFLELKKVDGNIHADFSDAPILYCPQKYLSSIFHNLISNAIHYHSPERPLSIKLLTQAKKNKIVLTVQDNGQGIDLLKHKHNIFKIGKVFHRRPGAKGLGLFMTKTQVEAIGGTIWVDSEPDQGARFSIEFVNQSFEAL